MVFDCWAAAAVADNFSMSDRERDELSIAAGAPMRFRFLSNLASDVTKIFPDAEVAQA